MDDDTAPGGTGPAEPGEPESAYELLQRGTALLARRHHAQAAIVLERAARLEPRRGSILESLGRAYFMSGQLERAVETFEALLAVDPSSHYGHYALGRALHRLGRRAEGRTHLRLAVALAPHSRLYRGGLNRLGGAAGAATPAIDGDTEPGDERPDPDHPGHGRGSEPFERDDT